MAKSVPEGHHTVTPELVVPDVAKLIQFAERVFDAKITEPPMRLPSGAVMHAEIGIGDSRIMLAEPMMDVGPRLGSLYLYVDDVDGVYQRAIGAGAESMMEPSDQFWGDRMSGVKDEAGNFWWIATHKEDVPEDEVAKRAEAFMSHIAR